MDILVTTPKSEMSTAKKEGVMLEEEGGYWFRIFRFRPKKVEKGDRIYFIEDGAVRGYGIISDIVQLEQGKTCDATGRLWGKAGDWLVKYNNWHWLNKLIPYRGFQGFRYVTQNIRCSWE